MSALWGRNYPAITIDQRNRLLQFLKLNFDLDLTNYMEESLMRRIGKVLTETGVSHVDQLIQKLSRQNDAKDRFLDGFTVNVTDYFRESYCLKKLVDDSFPKLAQREVIKIWVAGCSTGEEVLSLSILLHEYNLLDRCRIFATDISKAAINKAQNGEFTATLSKRHEQSYRLAGGKARLQDHLEEHNGITRFREELLRPVEFEVHDLIQQPRQEQFDLIICRNVLIYFKRQLQHQVLQRFDQNLNSQGFLMIGSKESLIFYLDNHRFREVTPICNIYQKTG